MIGLPRVWRAWSPFVTPPELWRAQPLQERNDPRVPSAHLEDVVPGPGIEVELVSRVLPLEPLQRVDQRLSLLDRNHVVSGPVVDLNGGQPVGPEHG